jgi:hypothetical protein
VARCWRSGIPGSGHAPPQGSRHHGSCRTDRAGSPRVGRPPVGAPP